MFYKKGTKRMSRKDLLELLVIQCEKIDELEIELKRVNELLNDKEIKISKAGSIAEAALQLNGVFEAAEKAVGQYLENVKGEVER